MKKITNFKISIFLISSTFLGFALNSCSKNKDIDPALYCIKNQIKGKTYAVYGYNGQVYDGTTPTHVKKGQITFTDDKKYRSSYVTWKDSGSYKITENSGCDHKVTIEFTNSNTGGVSRYDSYEDNAETLPGKDPVLKLFKLRNKSNSSDTLTLYKE